MIYAIILVVVFAAALVVPDKLKADAQLHHQFMVDVTAAEAFVAFAFVATWLSVGIPRGEYPVFDLTPMVIIGILFTVLAIRFNKTYNLRYGITPASS